MDISTLAGLVSGTVFIVVSILLSGRLGLFFDIPSVMIVIGGSIAALLVAYPMPKFLASIKTIKFAFINITLDPNALIQQINEFALLARKEGLLALEEKAQNVDDPFLKKGILLVCDGTDPDLVRSILETEIVFLEERHKEHKSFWETLGEYGPAWGMIGTLIGLICMLDELSDPSSLGPKMAVALITTLYGSLIANFIANPMANKMKTKSSEEILLKQAMIEGLLSIQAGENPRVIEEKLKAFISPALRSALEGTGE